MVYACIDKFSASIVTSLPVAFAATAFFHYLDLVIMQRVKPERLCSVAVGLNCRSREMRCRGGYQQVKYDVRGSGAKCWLTEAV